MLERGINPPLTLSVGRLFDSVAAFLGFCQVSNSEGQAAMAMESAADRATQTALLPPAVVRANGGNLVIDWEPLLASLVRQCIDGEAREKLAAALQDGLVEAIVETAGHVGLQRVILTGGCFQNARLTERAVQRLRAAGFQPYWHHRTPPKDGGLAAGPIAFAAHPLIEERA